MVYWLILNADNIVVGHQSFDGSGVEPTLPEGEHCFLYEGDPKPLLGKRKDGTQYHELSQEEALKLRWATLDIARQVYISKIRSTINKARGYVDTAQYDLYKAKYQEALQVTPASTADPLLFPLLAPEVGIKHPTIQALAAVCIQQRDTQEALKASSELTRVSCQASINAATTFLEIHEAFTTHFPNEEI